MSWDDELELVEERPMSRFDRTLLIVAIVAFVSMFLSAIKALD